MHVVVVVAVLPKLLCEAKGFAYTLHMYTHTHILVFIKDPKKFQQPNRGEPKS